MNKDNNNAFIPPRMHVLPACDHPIMSQQIGLDIIIIFCFLHQCFNYVN